jgi:cholesterol transport system auxiliary component
MRTPGPLPGALACLLLAACGGFNSSQRPPQLYALSPLPAAGASSAPGAAAHASPLGGDAVPAWTLVLARPLAAPGLDTDRIALRRGLEIDYYAASRWPGAAPDVLRAAAIEALGASGKFRVVAADTASFAADEVLQVELRDFQAEYAGGAAPVVHVRLAATLARRASRELVASVVAESSVAAGENRMQAVVDAFRRATAEALRQLADALPPAAPVPAATGG